MAEDDKDDEMVPITFKVKRGFLRKMEEAMKITHEDQSQFGRSALKDRIESHGIILDEDAHLGRSRAGVGGKPTHRIQYTEGVHADMALHDKPSSTLTEKLKAAAASSAAEAERPIVKYPRSRKAGGSNA